MRRLTSLALLLAFVLVAGACSSDEAADRTSSADSPAPTSTTAAAPYGPLAYAGYESELYGTDDHWLCRPGLAGSVCDRDLDTTVIEADGSTRLEPFVAAEDAPVDCFYVYPTISRDEGVSADLQPGEDEEIGAVLNQAARLGSVCDVYAPVYRQVTLSGISGGGDSDDVTEAFAAAYGDVLDAFQQYIAHDNDGRGFVLVGHSQGAGLLGQLISQEIDDDPALRDHLVSALLLGNAVAVPPGEDVGGSFAEIPLCTEDGQIGCVITYASFRDTSPPPATSFFGRVRPDAEALTEHPDAVAACTNPAALGGGPAPLSPYFPTGRIEAEVGTDQLADEPVTTPFVSFPGLLRGECVSEGGFDYLEVTVEGGPEDARVVDDVPGDLTPQWGLHLVDANIAMGDLVDRDGEQVTAYSES